MLMKVFRHGVGRGASVINYVLDAKDSKRQHSPPTVLRGDPEQVKQLIDTTSRKWRYTSGVLSWAPDDKVTPKQEQQLMDSFESHAFAGMEPDQYSILWVRHSHAGRHEMHFVIPRTELRTDRALNPCPPGWDKQYNPLCELWNRRNNWARPDEATRARLVSPGVTLESYRSGTAAEVRTAVTEALIEGVQAGAITDRQGIVAALEGIGFSVPRQGKDYITVEVPSDTTQKKPQRIRLKGALYAESWNAAEQSLGLGQQAESSDGRTDQRITADNARRIAELEQRVAKIRKARATFNTKRFGRRGEAQQRGAGRDVSELASYLDSASRDNGSSDSLGLRGHNRYDIPLDQLRERKSSGTTGDKQKLGNSRQEDAREGEQPLGVADYTPHSTGRSFSQVSQRDGDIYSPDQRRFPRSSIGEIDNVRTQKTNFADAIKDARGTSRTTGNGAVPFPQSRQIGKRTPHGQAASEPLGRKLERCCSNLRKVTLRLQQFAEKQLQKKLKMKKKRGWSLGK